MDRGLKRMSEPGISQPDENTLVVFHYGKSYQITRTHIRLAAGGQVEAVTMPRADHFTKVVDRSLA
jgi:hypothetical protein